MQASWSFLMTMAMWWEPMLDCCTIELDVSELVIPDDGGDMVGADVARELGAVLWDVRTKDGAQMAARVWCQQEESTLDVARGWRTS